MLKQLVIKNPLLIFAGLIIGWLACFFPGTLFILLVTLISISLITNRCTDEREKKFIFLLFAVGFLSRIIACSVLHVFATVHNIGYVNEGFGVVMPDLFADSGAYSLRGWFTSQYLQGKLGNAEGLDQSWLFYDSLGRSYNFVVYTIFYYFFGFAQLSAKFINCLLGALSAILVYFISKDVFNRATAKVASFLTMFFPSLFIWSLGNLKEIPTIFLLCVIILASIKFNKYHKSRYIFFIFTGIFLITMLRPNFPMMLLLSAFFSIILCVKKKIIWRAVIIVILFALLANLFSLPILHRLENEIINAFKRFIEFQRGFVGTGGSVYKIYDERFYYGQIVDINPLNFFIYLPKSWLYFLFTPFPWDIHTKLQLISYPQIVLWYFLAFFAILGILSVRSYKNINIYVVLFYIFFITSTLALVSGNIGTALRHRDLVLPFFFIFSAAGLVKIFGNKAESSD